MNEERAYNPFPSLHEGESMELSDKHGSSLQYLDFRECNSSSNGQSSNQGLYWLLSLRLKVILNRI